MRDLMKGPCLAAVTADRSFEGDARAKEVGFCIELSHTPVDQPATDIQYVKQGDLTRLVRILGLALFGLERRDDVCGPGVESLLRLSDPDTGRPHIGDDLRTCRGIEPTRAFDFGSGAPDSTRVPIEDRQFGVDARANL